MTIATKQKRQILRLFKYKFQITDYKSPLAVCLFCVFSVTGFALDRNAFTFTHYDLRAQVVPAQQAFRVNGRINLRNDSPVAQRFVALQISSTLAWQSIKLAGKPLAHLSEPYTTDIDHTGSVSEAIVTLPNEIAPQSTVELEIEYAGTIPAEATRLTRIGAPAQIAARSDWDQISDDFTAVRGVGYVCWYPVAIEAASLSEGSRAFRMIGAWKQRHAASTMRLTLILRSEQLVVTNGRLLGQRATSTAEGTVHERDYDFAPIGLAPPTFAVAAYTVLSRPALNVLYLPGTQAGAQDYVVAAEKLLPFITDWFGPQHQKVAVVGLPEGNLPFDSGPLLFTALTSSDHNAIEIAISHQLVHACFMSPRPWVAEGLAHFGQVLIRERQDGRKAALAYMQQFRPPLAVAEKQARAAPPADGSSGAEGEPLVRATDEIYYRSKAMFVWWMLRDMVGDEALQRVLHQYRAVEDKEPSYVQRLVEAQAKRSLEWFFDDWVYRDRGLPDFRIDAVFPRQMLPEHVTVTVTVQNEGDAGAEVPVMIPVEGGEATQRLLVAARAKGVTRITVPAAPAEVVVNDGSVPESDMSNNSFVLKKPE